jgi:bacterioferritin-associated ferredoxin
MAQSTALPVNPGTVQRLSLEVAASPSPTLAVSTANEPPVANHDTRRASRRGFRRESRGSAGGAVQHHGQRRLGGCDPTICNYHKLSESTVITCVKEGANSCEAVTELTKAASGCGSCKTEVSRLVQLHAKPALAATG